MRARSQARRAELRVYVIGLGSNLGSRHATIDAALALIDSRLDCSVSARSPYYETEPLGPPQPRFVNAAARIESLLSPEALLAVLLETEAALGRVRRERWGARVIDLDLLWAPLPFMSATLTVPHPGLRDRVFALAPLLDAAPELAPLYAERLRALREAEPNAAPSIRELARLEASVGREADGALRLTAHGALPDAVAAVLVALGRELHAPCGTLHAHHLRAERADPAALLARVVEEARRGLCFGHVSVTEGASEARVIGAHGAPRAVDLLDVTSDSSSVALRVRIDHA